MLDNNFFLLHFTVVSKAAFFLVLIYIMSSGKVPSLRSDPLVTILVTGFVKQKREPLRVKRLKKSILVIFRITLVQGVSEKIGKTVGERFGTQIKEVVPPQMFLITDASKTESPVYICCLVMWEVPPGYILRGKKKGSVIVSDSGELNLKSAGKRQFRL